ncbi:enhancer of split M2 protein [Scaptodrosophila lebanonensis]|uniref:Enhancer of split M2 protein n=1 Tax=Drosophila lebanonensis TaxID=7225 RepID=A0A6J2TMV6_DROLE|nr:enhancer of split M2 protein [Scaptodrosophila lebanonensis]
MYLDTKNLMAASQSTTALPATPKSSLRMRKVWQPLRRLLSVGGQKNRAPRHPNNVDLNNTQPELRVALEPLDLQAESKTLEESQKIAQSLEDERLSLPELSPPPNTPTLISSVSVEKASPQSCRACQHGRNCQHGHHNTTTTTTAATAASATATHHSSSSSSNASSNASPQSPTLLDLSVMEALNLPLQYISTDNGTFFWANTQERVDDDLLHAWLCQSFSQLPGTLC